MHFSYDRLYLLLPTIHATTQKEIPCRQLRSSLRHALKHSCRLVFRHYLPKSLGNSDICHSCFKRLIGGKETKSLSHQILSLLFHSSQRTAALHTYHTVHTRFSLNMQQKKCFDCFHIDTQECLSRETWLRHAINMSNLATSVCCNKQNRNARLWRKIHSFI